MKVLIALLAVVVLLLAVWVGVGMAGQAAFFGIVLPYAALAVFLIGMVYRVLLWAGAPVPFHIPTVCGQQRSHPWLRRDPLGSPSGTLETVGRMAGEILLFRSLFRNTRVGLTPAERVTYRSDKLLWLGALAFHWSFLLIFLRHLRFFLEPTPGIVHFLEAADGFFQLTVPTFLLSNAAIVLALLYLLGRRLLNAQVRYISLPSDYLALFLLLGVVASGITMRYLTKVDLVHVKELSLGLATFRPVLPDGIGLPFFFHIALVSLLFLYFPFSKLVHMGGVFLSPTRNLANDSRRRRHVNPWNPDVEVHTYAQWEEEFRDKLAASGIPLDRS